MNYSFDSSHEWNFIMNMISSLRSKFMYYSLKIATMNTKKRSETTKSILPRILSMHCLPHYQCMTTVNHSSHWKCTFECCHCCILYAMIEYEAMFFIFFNKPTEKSVRNLIALEKQLVRVCAAAKVLNLWNNMAEITILNLHEMKIMLYTLI